MIIGTAIIFVVEVWSLSLAVLIFIIIKLYNKKDDNAAEHDDNDESNNKIANNIAGAGGDVEGFRKELKLSDNQKGKGKAKNSSGGTKVPRL